MSTEDEKNLALMKRALTDIQQKLPHLQIEVDENHPEVELMAVFPVQPGLSHEVCLNLQNGDELHFSTSHFWLSWFPCQHEGIVEKYVEAVSGFLSGAYRIEEHYRGKKCVKAELQVPEGDGWAVIGTSSNVLFSLPWVKKHSVIVQNAA